MNIDKLKMLGYEVVEHTDRVSIAISEQKVRMIIVKDTEVYLDTDELSSEPESIRSIHSRKIGMVLVIKVVYFKKNSDDEEEFFTLSVRVDSYSNVIKKQGVSEFSIMEDDKHWMAVTGNNIYVCDKKTLKKVKLKFNGTDRKNLKYYCSTNEHCVLLDTTFVDTETGFVKCFDSVSQCGQYLMCGYRLTGIANFSVKNVQGIIRVDNGNLYFVTDCYKAHNSEKYNFVVERNGEKDTLHIDIRENKSRTAFVQPSGDTVSISRN